MFERGLFLLHGLRHPKTVSSLIPTRTKALRTIADLIDGSRRRVVVEYGPGTGGLARILVEPGKLTEDSSCIFIEKTEGFAEYLRHSIDDPRARVFHDCAENVQDILQDCGESQADYVLSSIPLTTVPEDIRATIIRNTHEALARDGAFIVYLYRRRVEGHLRAVFPEVTNHGTLPNIPPLAVFEARKGSLQE